MALLKKLEEQGKDAPKIHAPVDGTFTVFSGPDGRSYLQIDTYGSRTRRIPGKVSQSLQFGPEALEQLRRILAQVR